MVSSATELDILMKGYAVLDAGYQVLDSRIPFEGASCEACCMHNTPIVSLLEAKYLLANNTIRANELLDICLGWLTDKSININSYQRIRGRAYTPGEDNIIAQETEIVKRISCPFVQANGGCYFGRRAPMPCLAGSMERDSQVERVFLLMRLYHKRVAPQLAMASFLPALLAKEINPMALRDLIDQGEIADAKIAIQKHLPSIYGDEENSQGYKESEDSP